MRWSLLGAAALLLCAALSHASADEIRTAAHARPLAAPTALTTPVAVSADGARPNFRTVQPTPLARRGTLFGSVYRGDNEPVNPNLLRHALPNRSRRQAITW